MTTPAAPLASQPDPMLSAFTSRAQQTAAPAPTASPSASGDPMLDAFTARKTQAAQPQAAAPEQAEQPGFGQRTYEASGLKGIIETAKQKWQASQAEAQEEQKMAESAVEALKSKNYGQAAELILGHLAKHVGLGPGTGTMLDVAGGLKSSLNSAAEGTAKHIVKGVQAAKGGHYGTAALEGAGALGADDSMIEDIENKNVPGLAGDVVGGGIKAGVTLLGTKGIGGEAAAGEEAAAAAKPGFIKQVIKGEKVAQAPARQALESGAKASAEDAGVAASATKGKGLRTLLDEPISSAAKSERAAYDTINKAAGTDLKSLYDYRTDLEDALEDPTNIGQKSALQKELKTTQDAIEKGEAQAQKGGVSPETVKQAEGMTKQRFAMENLKQKLFNNESVVEGNAAHGAEESINVKSAIREVEKLDKPSRFAPEGSPSRLQQALGEKGATQLKQALYDAQKAGESALTKQRIAKVLGGLAGLGGVQTFVRGLMDH